MNNTGNNGLKYANKSLLKVLTNFSRLKEREREKRTISGKSIFKKKFSNA